jgi:hypothetical protein
MMRGLNRAPTVLELPEAAELARCNMYVAASLGGDKWSNFHRQEREGYDTEPSGRGS